MSKDLQQAVNNFVMGFSLGDKVMARHDAAAAAAMKWQTMLQWRKADQAEKARRNDIYEKTAAAHINAMNAQAEKARRGPTGGGRISIGSAGKPAYSPADQAYINKQVQAGYTPPPAQDSPQQPTMTVDLPEQPDTPIGTMPTPPADDGGMDATTGAMFNDARGGIVPRSRFARGGRVPLAAMGVGGTSGPGSGYGVRAAPPSYQAGGGVQLPSIAQDPLFYLNPGAAASTVLRRTVKPLPRGPMTKEEKAERERDAELYENPKAQLPFARPGATQPTVPTAPAAPAATPPPATVSPLPPSTEKTDEGMDQFNLPRGGTAAPPRLASGTAYPSEPDVPPQGVAPARRGNGGSRGAVDTGEWKGLRDQSRTKAFDYNKDLLDPDNYHYTTSTGEVAPWAQQDWAGRWNGNNLFPTQGQPPPQDRAQTWARGGPVRRFAFGGPTGGTVENLNLASPVPQLNLAGGSANAATGSGGDSTGGASGTGGVGGSASDSAGGSAAAGVGGDDGGTYRRGGAVRRYARGGVVRRFADGGPTGGGAGATTEADVDPIYETRMEYETGLKNVKSPEEANSLWQDYKIKMKHLDPNIRFADEGGTGTGVVSDPVPLGIDRGRSGTAAATEPDVPPQPMPRDRGAGSYPSEPDVPPQGMAPARRRGAIDTGRWKGLRDQTRTEAFDPVKDRGDPDNVNIVDDTGAVNPPQGPPAPAIDTRRGPQAGEGAMGGYGLNPQGANAQGAGLSTNNAANDLTPIMKAASDFAAHAFHLIENDEHSAAGYHAVMAGHGAAPINLIEDGFKKIDPAGTMPINLKIEKLTENLYDYYVARNEPDKAAKVAYEVAAFGSNMAKTHAAQAGDLLQKGDFNGAMNHLVGGYNWLVDGHSADYDPRTRMITLRDSKTNQVTGQIQATPQLVQNLTLGMMSGELNWDIMRGRGGAQPPAQQPPGAQAPPGPPPSSPPVQPAAAPAGPPQQPSAAPPPQAPAPPLPPQGDGGPPGSPAGAGPPQAVQPTPPPQLARNTVITSTPPPPGPSSTVRPAAPPPAPPAAPPPPTQPTRPQAQPPTQPKPPAQGDQTEPVEGSEEWYAKNPNKVPNRTIRRASLDAGEPPDSPAVVNELARRRQAEINRVMSDAASGNLSQSGKGLPNQFIAQINNKYDKALADLANARKEWNTTVRDLDRQESSRIQDRKDQSQSTESNLETNFEKYLASKRAGYDDLDQVAEAKRIRDQLQKTGRTDAKGENFNMVTQSPLRYMATPEDRARLKEVATQIWIKNPGMSERSAIEHALNFTSLVAHDGRGHNNATGDKGTTYRMLGHDTLRNVVIENEAGEQVHVGEETMRQIQNLRRANADDFKTGAAKRTADQADRAKHGNMLERTGRELRKIIPLDPIVTGPARALGELIPRSK